MKFLETKCEDYIQKCQTLNLHPELSAYFAAATGPLADQNNLILYGPKGVGKYTQALNYVRHFSPTALKYERKMNINFQNKRQHVFRISDIHFEVDMQLLGCNARVLWNKVYHHILDILSTRQNQEGIIVCKNFQCIHSELLDIFYSYMQTLAHRSITLTYVILTEQISFIPSDILKRCMVIPVRRPTKARYGKCLGAPLPKHLDMDAIVNIKDLQTGVTQLMNPTEKIVRQIVDKIKNYDEMEFLAFRDLLYDIFIYHLDINECMWEVITHLIKEEKITTEQLGEIFSELYGFLKFFNNNYRPIYHLEKFTLTLCKIIHGL